MKANHVVNTLLVLFRLPGIARMSLVIRLWSVTAIAGDKKVKLATFQRMAKNDNKKRQDKTHE